MTSFPQSQSESDFANTRFLVVDDKPVFRNVVHSVLAGRTAGIKDALSVDQAVDILNQPGNEIGCIVCDWDMAPVGGLELLRMIRCGVITHVSQMTSVVILTARADANAVRSAMELDVNGFAVEPLSFEKLRKTIAGALKRRWLLQHPGHYVSVAAVAPPAQPKPMPAPVATIMSSPSYDARPGFGRPLARRGSFSNVRVCALEDIQPGFVLARDLRDTKGHLLLGTGTELKPAVISRLKHAARWRAENYELWVGEREGHA